MTSSSGESVGDPAETSEPRPLRIVVCHNYYQQRGGEDQVFEDEVDLLRAHGHEVIPFVRHSGEIPARQLIPTAVGTVWNRPVASELGALVEHHRADIAHFHNWLPLISLAAPVAARDAGAAVVHTLQNYRFACPKGTFFRDGSLCEECLSSRTFWPAVQHGCYRESRAASALVATALITHRARGTLTNTVDAFAAGSAFTASKLSQAGLPAERIFVKPNFLAPDPGIGSGSGGYAIYLGRLSPEKGISTLLEAWGRLGDSVPLRIAGTGPLQSEVERFAASRPHVTYLGFASDAVVDQTIKEAGFLVLPSVNYEGFPKTIVEAFARGTPVVASRLGAMQDAISPGVNGRHFRTGDPADLAAVAVELTDDRSALRSMREAARSAYLNNYTPEHNYAIMMEIYRFAQERRRTGNEGEQ